MATPEGRVRDPVVRFAKARGVIHIRMAFRPGVTAGCPDDLFLIPGGLALFIEFKRPGKEPTPLQAHKLEKMRELGFAAIWTDSADQARAAITQALDTAALHGARRPPFDDPRLGRPRARPRTP